MDRALLSVALVFLCAASPSRGAVRVPSIFSDGMVLQTNDESGMRGASAALVPPTRICASHMQV